MSCVGVGEQKELILEKQLKGKRFMEVEFSKKEKVFIKQMDGEKGVFRGDVGVEFGVWSSLVVLMVGV